MAVSDLLVRIGVDSTAFDSGIKNLNASAASALGNTAAKIDEAASKAAQSAGKFTKASVEQQNAIQALGRQYTEGTVNATEFLKAAGKSVDLSKTATEAARLEGEIARLTKRFEAGRIGINDYQAKLGELKRAQDAAAASAKKSFDFAGVGGTLQGFGASLVAGVSAPIAGLAIAATKAFGEIDALKRALATVEGSTAGAEARFIKLAKAAELPGLGLEQAIRADVRLRAIGLSANLSERAILGFGKALAGAGSGAADLDETIRQFGQLASASSLTAENLKPIIERVPQAGKILRDAFGSANAEELRKFGVTTQQVVDLLVSKLNELPDVSSGVKNSLENLSQAGRIAMAEFGKAIEPAAISAVESATKIIGAFKDMSVELQTAPKWAKEAAGYVAGIAFVGPFAIVGIGTVLNNFTRIKQSIEAIKGVALTTTQTLRTMAPFLIFREAPTVNMDAFDDFAKGTDDLQRRLSANVPKLQASADQMRASLQSLNDAVKGGAVKQIDAGPAIKVLEDQLRSMGEPLTTTIQRFKGLGGEIEKFAKAGGALKFLEKDAAFAALAAEYTHRYEQRLRDVAKAKLDLSEGKGLVIEFGPPPDISKFTEKIPKILLDVGFKFPESDALKKESADEVEFGNRMNAAIERQKELASEFKKTGDAGKKAMQQVSLALTQTARGITEAAFEGGKFGDKMLNVAKEIGKGFTQLVLESIGKSIFKLGEFKAELNSVAASLKKLFSGVTAAAPKALKTGIDAASGAAAGAAGAVAGGAATTAASSAAANTAAGAAATAGAAAAGIGQQGIPNIPGPPGAPSPAGAASAAIGSSLTGIVTAVAGVASAISGIVGNFQMAGMNKSLDVIVNHTLRTANDLANLRADEFTRKDEYFTMFADMFGYQRIQLDTLIQSVRANPAGVTAAAAGGGTVNNFALSAFVAPGGEAQFFDWFAGELRRRRLIN